MSYRSNISWTEATWSPVTGCTKVSPGCAHCYIERTPPLRMAGRRFTPPPGVAGSEGVGASTGVLLHPDRLVQPLRWRKPRRIFVCSLADLFHQSVPDAYLAEVFAIMAMASQHTYQVLTKRHARMRAWLAGPGEAAVRAVLAERARTGLELTDQSVCFAYPDQHQTMTWPLPHVWVGVTAETQQWAQTRIPALLAAPAAVRWVSAEPLLGPLTLHRWLPNGHGEGVRWNPRPSFVTGPAPTLDWVVTGGESGPGARPAPVQWFRSLRDQCQAAGIAYHHKQHGEWVSHQGQASPGRWCDRGPDGWVNLADSRIATTTADPALAHGSWAGMWRVGRRAAGRVLDGVTHDAYPDPALDTDGRAA